MFLFIKVINKDYLLNPLGGNLYGVTIIRFDTAELIMWRVWPYKSSNYKVPTGQYWSGDSIPSFSAH